MTMKNMHRRLAIVCLLALIAVFSAGPSQAEDKKLAGNIDALLNVDFKDKLPLIMAWRTSEIALSEYSNRYDEAARIADTRNDERSTYILDRADDFIMNDVRSRLAELYTEEYAKIIESVYKKLYESDPSLKNRKMEVLELIDQRITRMIAAAGRYLEQARPGS
jgi:hypothetical protein